MERARASLVELLAEYRKRTAHEIVIVFDGYKSGKVEQQVFFSGYVKVIYNRLGEKTDDVIKRTISGERVEWIVVTADRDIADHAWAVGSVPVLPERFMDIIMRPVAADEHQVQVDEEVQDERHSRKGNPHQLSKKEKAIRRVLKKL